MAKLVSNKKAHFNYEMEDTLTAGIELFGHEVKSLRKSHGSLEGAHVIVRGGEAFLVGSYIPPYQPNNLKGLYDERRPRRLLLNKKEIRELSEIESKKGQAVIPLSFFPAGKKIKVEIAVARGKRKFDKREALKKRDTNREMRRNLRRKI